MNVVNLAELGRILQGTDAPALVGQNPAFDRSFDEMEAQGKHMTYVRDDDNFLTPEWVLKGP